MVFLFLDWYNHQPILSVIKFVTPQQRYSGEAIQICRQLNHVYKQARLENQNAGADQFVARNNLIWYGLMNHYQPSKQASK